MQKMDVLVIGNGFDLAHGLPTKYIDFLEFIRDWENHVEEFDKIKSEKNTFLEWRNEFPKIIADNCFIQYFLSLENKKENWVDFEKEIYAIVRMFKELLLISIDSAGHKVHKLTNSDPNIMPYFKKYIDENQYVQQNSLRLISKYSPIQYKKTYHPDTITKLFINDFRVELNELIECLNIYFTDFVKYDEVVKIPKQIYDIKPSTIINFNYTNTYEIMRMKILPYWTTKDFRNFHIHGKLEEISSQHNIIKNNIVLGIEDYGKGDLTFFYYKKYFQRIQKKTDINFLTVLKELIDKNGRDILKIDLHIMGHSLDVVDKDIFEDLILNLPVNKVNIFYLDQDDYEAKVINLIKIFGVDEFVKLNNVLGKIEFIELLPPVALQLVI